MSINALHVTQYGVIENLNLRKYISTERKNTYEMDKHIVIPSNAH